MKLPLFAATSVALLFSPTLPATDYYVSPSGNDANAGTSQAAPWKTIARVNGRSFAAGDRILFEGGRTFAGSLYFDPDDAGSAANPIRVSSYGSGRATVSAGTASGLFAYNTAGITVSDLVFVGAGAANNPNGGVEFYNDLPGSVRLQHVHIDNVDSSGFRRGIVIGAWNGKSGYNDVRVTRSVAHHNQREGMMTYAQALYGHTKVYVGYSVFHDNLGDPDWPAPTGNGLVLAEVDGGVIERSIAYNNGIRSKPGQGPVGIWSYNSNNVVIQHNESYANRTSGTTDGGGFDLDMAMTNSVMQYNYSHDNDGAGFGLYQVPGAASWSNNVVRYNVSENDGRKNGYGAITVWSGGPVMSGCDIYGNTIYIAPSASGSPRALRFKSGSDNFRLFNNLFVTTGGARLIEVPAGQVGIVFQGNDYWSSGGAFSIRWNGTSHSSLSSWIAATGQEKIGANVVGRNVNPRLAGPGSGGTIGDPRALEMLAAYELQGTSPLIDAGLDLFARFGIDSGTRDYYGASLPQGAVLDIGAHEFALPTGPNRPPDVTDASAGPNPVYGTTTIVSANASDDASEAGLVYSWSVASAPAGGGASFRPNGSNAARSSTATFTKAGSYLLRVTAADVGALSDSFDVPVTVRQVLKSVRVTPSTATLPAGATKRYAAIARDQFATAMATQPTFTWSITGTRNSITQSGLATAGAIAGSFTVTAATGGKKGTATLKISP